MGSLRGSNIRLLLSARLAFIQGCYIHIVHVHTLYSVCKDECIYSAMHLKVAFASASWRTSFNVIPVRVDDNNEPAAALALYSQKNSIPFSPSRSLARSSSYMVCNNSVEKATALSFPSGAERNREKADRCLAPSSTTTESGIIDAK